MLYSVLTGKFKIRRTHMKTLILNGSPRKNGDTAAMINRLLGKLDGESLVINAYRDNISPCVDCRRCRTVKGCVIKDDMQKVYEYIADCDCVVIASPVYYSELTGRLLDVASRFQMYFSAKYFMNEPFEIKPKKGGVLLAAGGLGSAERAYDTARSLLTYINAKDIYPMICSKNTDVLPAAEDTATLDEIDRLAKFLNG